MTPQQRGHELMMGMMRPTILATFVLSLACSSDGGSGSGGDDTSEGAADVTSADGGGDDGGPQPASSALDDAFDGPLRGWSVLHGDEADVSVSGGELHIEPHALSLWFEAETSVLVYKPVLGDVIVDSFVRARALSDGAVPPAPPYRLGGLMVRDGGVAAENYAFIVVGADDTDVSIETKSTVDGQSEFQGPPWPSGEAVLRICRIGARVRLLARGADGAWQERAAFDRPDFGDELQVGAVAYANVDPADLRVSFDAIRFRAPMAAADCTD